MENMKKANLIINVILIIAVGTLFILYFTGNNKQVELKPVDSTTMVSDTSGLGIAYVQIDSVLANMKMFKDLNGKLEGKQKEAETKFTSQYKSFEKEVNDYQNKVQKGLVTRSEAQTLEQQLAAKNTELETQRNNYLRELQEENMVSQNKVIDYIMSYLKEFNQDKNYRYIFSYSFGGGILYAAENLDITKEVVEGLNAKYNQEQQTGKK